MPHKYKVVTKHIGYSIKETVEAESEVQARLLSQYADAGLQQSVTKLTTNKELDRVTDAPKRKLELCSPSY